MQGVFRSRDWRSLDPVDRAQILFVATGVKSGAIVGGKFRLTSSLLKRLGLFFVVDSHVVSGKKFFTFAIASNKSVLDRFVSHKGLDHVVAGKFLGYPSCCIREYARKRTKRELGVARSGNRMSSYKFGRQLFRLKKLGKQPPSYLNFSPPAFTPCSISCDRAKKMLLSYKAMLNRYDHRAAKALFEWNVENRY